MLYEMIDTAGIEPVECPIRRDLARLAAELDTRFLRAGTVLADAIALVDRIIAGLDTVVEALGEERAGAAARDLAAIAARITALPTELGERSTEVRTIAAIAAVLRQQVLDMHRSLRVLGIYGMNIKIAASGEAQFVGFVDGMNGKLASGEALLSGLIATLKELEAGLSRVQQVDRLLAAECAKAVPAVPERLAADAARLDDHLRGVASLAHRVAAIARSIQAKVGVVLGALQVGDSTRQRLEHVVSSLHIVESHGCGAGAAAYVDRLLAAQLDAIVASFERETRALVGSLVALVPDAHALLELIGEQAGDDGRGFLSRLDDSVSEMDRIIFQLQSAQHQAQRMTTLVATTVSDLTHRVGSLRRIRTDVQDIATNTRLLCRRHGAVGRAVAVVAQEVDAYARDLGTTTDQVARTIGRLADAEGTLSLRGAGTCDIGEMLGGALGVIRQACHRTEQVVRAGGDEAARLVEVVRTTASELAAELALSDTMAALAAALTARAGEDAALTAADESSLREVLPAIARLYTMAGERQIHASYQLPGMDAVLAAPVADDEDDGLF
ncbi:hypothetical protein K7957_03765 [Sphingomonas yunnanensis]|uniref:hypothetical protein n=1 Tax=Sphingomonas yunnanensis TaxID=310400 RepID=UPI001CA6B4A8|nr:hypothetical protein [Sphingomonas yunnanensis]MBY9062046.1 hypothetical protein [Sphingomonas yunnanensis]